MTKTKRPKSKSMPIADVNPRSTNPRRHTPEQVKLIADSIRRFGFLVPIVIDKDSCVIAGHARLEAARALGMKHVPVVSAEHLTSAEADAFVIVDNRLAELASWEGDALAAELRRLVERDFDMELLGFESRELQTILSVEAPPTSEQMGDDWKGMPKFENEDLTPHRTIHVHFESDEDVAEFGRRLDVAEHITDKTRWLWYPYQERHKLAGHVEFRDGEGGPQG